MDCANTAALEEYLLRLSPDQHQALMSAFQSGTHEPLLKADGIDLASCDYVALLALVRRRFAALSDEDLAALSGGEIKVTAAIVGAGLATTAAVAVGVGVVVGT